jgi:cytoskeletal protein CcmA (bactofilin family)
MSTSKDTSQDSAAPQARTIVDEGTRFKGTLSSTSPILVQGTVEGDVSGPAISVSATGTVSGKVVAGSVKSAGTLAGSYDVDAAQIAGKVAPDTVVRASSVHIKLAAAEGRLELRFDHGNEPK